jgi:hypothetical protein
MKKDSSFGFHFDLGIDAIRTIYLSTNIGRPWWVKLYCEYKLHPVVHDIIYNEGIRPIDWHLLLLEWPHIAKSDESRLAYTRNERAGIEDKQTMTAIGKYLSRHWPHVRDDIRRDWAGRYAPGMYEIWDTKEGIISGVERGPQSCMKSTSGSVPFHSGDNAMLMSYYRGNAESNEVPWRKHPYAVYAPEYGWRMAVRLDPCYPAIVFGRAMVNVSSKCTRNGAKGVFVRSYKRGACEHDYSHTDERLEDWLQTQGYTHESSWPDGLKLARIDHPNQGGFMAPYIDGGTDRVDDCGGHLMITEDGSYECTNTDGTVDGGDDDESMGDCEDCGSTVYENEEDRIWAGRDETRLICGCCAENYAYVTGTDRHGRDFQYHVKDDNIVEVDDTKYDGDNLPDYIVYCNDEKYRHTDDVIFVAGEYYEEDDESIVKCADGEWRIRADCWQDKHTEEWYSDDEDGVDLEEGKYHPDSLRSMADNA